ncbi:MAG: VCBS repeat-containing protein [Planctomycetota bacterium]
MAIRFLVTILLFCLPIQIGFAQSKDIRLNDQSASLPFSHDDGAYGQFFLIESMSGGLAMLDYDNDGDLDIYLLNGARIDLPGDATGRRGRAKPINRLYRNDGAFQFTDVTLQAGVGDPSMSLGVATADYDNDGWQDIYVNNYGTNTFYHNNGDGTYSVRTDRAGVNNGFLVGGGASFFDKDLDGDLDLYVGNYIKFDVHKHKVHYHKGLPAYPSPMSFEPEVDHLFENNGDGTFRDVSNSSGIQDVAGRSMGLTTFD